MRMKLGPIVIVEDDSDDIDILIDVLRELDVRNPLIWFDNCFDAFKYLKTTSEQPFIILSDVNLPGQNGIEFKKDIDADQELRRKSIPFVFYSTSVAQQAVDEAFKKMAVQGFFQKGRTFEEIKHNIGLIIDYWSVCRHPNSR
jgi:CheY-like chemotaxis protein